LRIGRAIRSNSACEPARRTGPIMLCNSAAFVPAGARERLAAIFLRPAIRLAVTPVLSPAVPIAAQRRRLRQVMRMLRPARAVDIAPGKLGGVSGEWLRPRRPAADAAATILYLHGGAYCIGSPATHRALTSQLAHAASLPVFAADYRLAPEHPFPAALEDAVAACHALSEVGAVAIAGDSAGAGLALAATLALRQRQAAAPAALVLLSPWVDLTVSALAATAPAEVMLSATWLGACAQHYLAGQDAKAPLASPIFGDLRGLPPVLIQTSPDELLHGEALKLHDALDKAGVTVRCEIVPDRWHEFQLHAGMLPSAMMAIERAAEFVVSTLAPRR
jgi:acetyl esterase/lipase